MNERALFLFFILLKIPFRCDEPGSFTNEVKEYLSFSCPPLSYRVIKECRSGRITYAGSIAGMNT